MKCRHCQSERTIYIGLRIKCKDCGRTSSRIVRSNTPLPEERPICPECGSPKPFSRGSVEGVRYWTCKTCGRSYKDRSQEVKAEIPVLEVQIE